MPRRVWGFSPLFFPLRIAKWSYEMVNVHAALENQQFAYLVVPPPLLGQ